MSKVQGYQASQKHYDIKVEEDVYVTARDGVRVAVDIDRPGAPGKFPALPAALSLRQERAGL